LRLARGSEKELLAVGVPAALAVAAAIRWPGVATAFVSALLLATWLVVLYFFRDPRRVPPVADRIAVAPADGEVDAVESVREPTHLRSRALRISIFMSLFDVHVNRAPVQGKVTSVRHVPGRFMQAFRPEAARENEHNLITMQTRFGPVMVKQIAGIMARRVVCWVSPGDEVETGGRIGLVKFGSRVDLFLPESAEPAVRVGDRTEAGVTVVARWQTEQHDDQDSP
jgi:phosphatidylserine decarboxylase